MNEKKKKNSYLRMGIILFCAMLVGGVIGFGGRVMIDSIGEGIGTCMQALIELIQKYMLPLLLIILILTVACGEVTLNKLRSIGKRMLQAGEEESDQLEYEEENAGGKGMAINVLSQVLSVIILSAGYSVQYIENTEKPEGFLISCLLFLICFAYDGMWQVRYIKTEQKIHPEKKGDPSSIKFQEQWLKSCDEAEKEIIYQSAYKVYASLGKCIPVLLLITMLGNLFFNTGMLAILVVAFLWTFVTLTYIRSCIKMQRTKIEK